MDRRLVGEFREVAFVLELKRLKGGEGIDLSSTKDCTDRRNDTIGKRGGKSDINRIISSVGIVTSHPGIRNSTEHLGGTLIVQVRDVRRWSECRRRNRGVEALAFGGRLERLEVGQTINCGQ